MAESNNDTVEIDRSLIGAASEIFTVEVEKGAIAKFADAIGDPNPLYRDAEFAKRHGHRDIIAPPTFPTAFRPPEEQEWTRHLDRRRVLAGEMAFIYERPIYAGDVLDCRIHFVRVDEKEGRSGKMEFLVQEVRGTDAKTGAAVFTQRRTTVYREPRKA